MRRFPSYALLCGIATIVLQSGGVAPTGAQEVTIVSPSRYESREADSVTTSIYSALRFQQVFSASDFASLAGVPHQIVRYAFRPDGNFAGTTTTTYDDVQVFFSVTGQGPGQLSGRFDQNVQNDPVLVYDGALEVTSENVGPRGGPKEFDQIIELQNPFAYDPSKGNLLLEVQSSRGFSGPHRSDFFSSPLSAMVAPSPDATYAESMAGGFVTQFTLLPLVPQAEQLQAGDADEDLDFDQFDLIQVQQSAKYLTGEPATWGQGDWNGAPGGQQGNPPTGNGLFDQLDIIAALRAGTYLTGPYAALAGPGAPRDGQTSIIYHAGTGEVSVDAPAGVQLTSINIDSAAGIFTGAPAQNLGGSFDNDADGNIFKATFGSSFGSLSFGNVAQPGLSRELVLSDLTVVGSLAGGGDLGAVDLIYVPEPSTALLIMLGWLTIALVVRLPNKTVQ